MEQRCRVIRCIVRIRECCMLSNPDAIEISSEKESPIRPMNIEEEVMIMSVGSSLIPKIKRHAQKPSSTLPPKRHTYTLDRV